MRSPKQSAPVRRQETITLFRGGGVEQSACCASILGQCILELPICP